MTTDENIKNSLLNLHIPEKQVDVYLALLELGEATRTQLSHLTGIKRSTLFYILEKMGKRGLIRRSIDQKTIQPISPQQLFENLQKNNLTFYHMLPSFQTIMCQPSKLSKISFYNGHKGIQQLLLNELEEYKKRKEKILRVIGPTVFGQDDFDFRCQYIQRRKELGVVTKMVASFEAKDFIKKNIKLYDNSQIKYWLPDFGIYRGRLSATQDRIVLIGLNQDKNGIIIESRELADTFIKWFDFTWSKL